MSKQRPRCPGQNMQYWKPEDIFDINCPYCGREVEFWKDEPVRTCIHCQRQVRNPRIDLGCAKWCKFAKECLGTLPDQQDISAPVIERLTMILDQRLAQYPDRLQRARQMHILAERFLNAESSAPAVVKPASLLIGALLGDDAEPDEIALLDNDSRRTILQQAKVDSSVVDEICAIVDALLTGDTVSSSPFFIVWDVLLIQRLSWQKQSQLTSLNPADVYEKLLTQTGKTLFTHRFD